MSNNFVFSWAENSKGEMVHVDSVPRGLQCDCICPCCHEQLLARHGENNEHGFAHHSEIRGVNLRMCYMVSLYKLAEQILQTKKQIHVPSYYGIIPERDLNFVDVKIDRFYDREDKQPDVIATTTEDKQYLIEFNFDYKVQHKQTIDYVNLNCLEVDLSNQTFETLESFLLKENIDKKWVNNQDYFDSIEPIYKRANKNIALKDEAQCKLCKLLCRCTAVKEKDSNSFIIIENNEHKYRMCKREQYEELKKKNEAKDTSSIDLSERTCFMCQRNLDWKNSSKDGYANCGAYDSMNVPAKTPTKTALTCKGFKLKTNNNPRNF